MANRRSPYKTDLPFPVPACSNAWTLTRRSLRYSFILIVQLFVSYLTVYSFDRIRRITSVPFTRTEVSTTNTVLVPYADFTVVYLFP